MTRALTGQRTASRFALGILLSTPAAFAAWNVQDVDAARQSGVGAVAVGSDGVFHLAYGADRIVHARRDSGAWREELVDPDACSNGWPSLAIDAGGQPAISYVADDRHELRLARFDGSRWNIETVQSVTGRDSLGAWASSLGFDGSGLPVLLVTSSISSVYTTSVLRFEDPVWASYPVNDTVFALSIDRSGEPALALYGASALEVARWNGSGFTSEVAVASVTPASASLGFDELGEPIVAWLPQFSGELHVARKIGGIWSDRIVDGVFPRWVSGFASLAIDSLGRPQIAYFIPNDGIERAKWTGSAWQIETVAPWPDLREYPGLALTPADEAVIVYSATTGSPLRVARETASGFVIDDVASDSEAGDRGQNASLALGPLGRLGIAYWDNLRAEVRYAEWNGASWDIEVVATGTQGGSDYVVPRDATLAISPSGEVAIPYLDFGDLIVARRTGTAWSYDTVESSDQNSGSAAYSGAGVLGVSYVSLDELHYVAWNPALAIETLPSNGNVFGETSLAFQSDVPWVAYADAGGLELAHWDSVGMSWVAEAVDPSANPNHLDLAVDSANREGIAYYDQVTREFRFATRNGPSWTIETIETLSFPTYGYGVSIGFDPVFRAHVAYVTSSDAAGLRYAVRSGPGTWTIETADLPVCGTDDDPSLAFDSVGNPAIAFHAVGGGDLRLASRLDIVYLYRGIVSSLAPGWQSAALPLTSLNDDATSPFPIPTAAPGSDDDMLGSVAPLLLYRLLGSSDLPTGNRLRAVKAAGGVVRVSY